MTGTNTWQDKVAIVTGGSSGIGKAVALELVRQGAKVVITGRNMDRLAEVAGNSAAIEAVQADAADPATGAVLVARALARWGRIDLIVNNAGAGQPMPLPAYDAEVISQMGAVNITAPSMLVKAGAEALKASKGAIVNIGTAVSRKDAPMMAHYAASKAALEHLTRAWALEFAGDGVRVNAIAPGPVQTGALTGMMGLPAEMAAQIEAQEAKQIPLGRRGVTEDIVPWVLRLGSAENAWLTGQILTVDGGWTLRE
ncbi:General stress protein 39 [Pelagimonas phthalicica]|uniref:General stress protein 39 n=1 Tax=Pelagimonas phthalicica TaxID=1037362 RepID=A0A238JHP7_9RHOB|nr:SDR family oxidoreductase [Pelagimonas phthalicica]TDS90030.1 NAD(P)-dependent dehydrogenase (short-subunit alcohol dehydrogenase family) [Pelagimonas phthalicica]SMX30198.1 General stress protein 39 [Pelagimonas phthalicica]